MQSTVEFIKLSDNKNAAAVTIATFKALNSFGCLSLLALRATMSKAHLMALTDIARVNSDLEKMVVESWLQITKFEFSFNHWFTPGFSIELIIIHGRFISRAKVERLSKISVANVKGSLYGYCLMYLMVL